jgi:hypothetical protein
MRPTRHIAIAAAAGLVALPGTPAVGKNGNDNRVIKTGSCTDGSRWKLKVKPDDGRLEVEFEVDQNRNGVRWNVTVRRNGAAAASGARTTAAPSGSFSFERRISGASGDQISAVAKRSGASCRGSVQAP